jgi:hypothetical protein
MVYLRLAAGVTTLVSQRFFIRSCEVPVPQNEMPNPVDRWCLAVVNSDMVVVTMNCSVDTRLGRFLAQTSDSIKVCLLLWFRQLSPVVKLLLAIGYEDCRD